MDLSDATKTDASPKLSTKKQPKGGTFVLILFGLAAINNFEIQSRLEWYSGSSLSAKKQPKGGNKEYSK